MATGIELAKVATDQLGKGITYEEMDCQDFVEYCLRLVGVNKNWRGSNHMWREALSWKGTPEECKAHFGEIPVGAWLFTLKFDGGEKARGYNDKEGNATHVGIYTGTGLGSVHSTTGGVQAGAFPANRWNRVGLPKCIDYNNPVSNDNGESLRQGLINIKSIVEGLLNGLA